MTAAMEAHRVALEGELTIFAVQAAKERLLAAFDQHPVLELDLSAVTEMDGAGMQLLLAARREAQLRDKPLQLGSISPAAADVLALCNLSAAFDKAASGVSPSEDQP